MTHRGQSEARTSGGDLVKGADSKSASIGPNFSFSTYLVFVFLFSLTTCPYSRFNLSFSS